jgi:SAM-dependent methyltransferase
VRQSQYAPGHSKRELDRLTRQAQAFEPFTRHLLELAGIDSGMRVLNVGSGSGVMAFLVADLVGSKGEVIGTDRAASAVEWANARARSAGTSHVVFLEGDPADMQFDRPFDAVVGRLVLMYCPGPIHAVRRLIRHLREGGLMVFQELARIAGPFRRRLPTTGRSVGSRSRLRLAVQVCSWLWSRLGCFWLRSRLNPCYEWTLQSAGGRIALRTSLLRKSLRHSYRKSRNSESQPLPKWRFQLSPSGCAMRSWIGTVWFCLPD